MPLPSRLSYLAAALPAAGVGNPEQWVSAFLNAGIAGAVLWWVLAQLRPGIDALATQVREDSRRTQAATDRLARALLADQLERPDLSKAGRKAMAALIAELDAAEAERTVMEKVGHNGR